jgi:hypothetical protein
MEYLNSKLCLFPSFQLYITRTPAGFLVAETTAGLGQLYICKTKLQLKHKRNKKLGV